MSDLSDGPDALDELDALVRRLGATLAELGWDVALHQLADELPDARDRLAYVGRMTEDAAMKVLNMVDAAQPVCQSAATEALELADRLQAAGTHAELGVGEARAALAEAAAALRHQAGLKRTQASGSIRSMMAPGFQGPSGQVVEQMALIISHAEQQLQQLLAPSAHAQPTSSSSARSMPPDSIEIIACSRTAGLPW